MHFKSALQTKRHGYYGLEGQWPAATARRLDDVLLWVFTLALALPAPSPLAPELQATRADYIDMCFRLMHI